MAGRRRKLGLYFPDGSSRRSRRQNMGRNPATGHTRIVGGRKAGSRKRKRGAVQVQRIIGETVQSPFTLGRAVTRTYTRTWRGLTRKGRR